MQNFSVASLRSVVVAAVFVFTAGPGGCQPVGEDMTPGLRGTDGNNNGIRDDIDRLIAEKYSSRPEIKLVAERYAISTQKFMEAADSGQAFIAAQAVNQAIDCVFLKLPGDGNFNIRNQMIDEIKAYTANTEERFKSYWESNRMVGGSTFSMGQGADCN